MHCNIIYITLNRDQLVINEKDKTKKIFSKFDSPNSQENVNLDSHPDPFLNDKDFSKTHDKLTEINKEEQLNKKRLQLRRKFCRVIKGAKAYIENNNIKISEFLENNPFNSKPFEMRYSSEFLDLVKFGEYDEVTKALNKTKKFLFVFDYYRQTAYHWAAKRGDLKMLEILIAKGKYVNQYDYKKRTPLFLATINNHFECCEFLIKNQGNPYMEDINGKKPIDVATDKKIRIFLSDYMDNKYNNPELKKKVLRVLSIKKDELKVEINVIKGNDERNIKEN